MINCASTYTAVALGAGRRRNRALGPPSLERGPRCLVGAVAGAVAAGRGCALAQTGRRQRPLISAKSNHRPIGGLLACATTSTSSTLRYSTATELRVDVIASTDGLDDRRFIIDLPAHGAPTTRRQRPCMRAMACTGPGAIIPTCRLPTTRRVGWELLRVVSAVRSELVKRDMCREYLIDSVRHTVGLAQSGDREPRTTAIAGHAHDLNRVPICASGPAC